MARRCGVRRSRNRSLDLFFVEAGRTIASSTVALCRKCPVRRACLDHAYQHEIVSGYFGGVSPGRRRVLSHAEAVAEISATTADPASPSDRADRQTREVAPRRSDRRSDRWTNRWNQR